MQNELHRDTYLNIAKRFQRKAKTEDREDLVNDIVLRLAELETNNGHHPFTFPAMLRVASYVVKEYWHNQKRKPTIFSLNSDIDNGEGDTSELWETLKDDKAIDLEAWVDARTWLLGCPKRLITIAYKKVCGIAIEATEQRYLNRFQRKELKLHQLSLS